MKSKYLIGILLLVVMICFVGGIIGFQLGYNLGLKENISYPEFCIEQPKEESKLTINFDNKSMRMFDEGYYEIKPNTSVEAKIGEYFYRIIKFRKSCDVLCIDYPLYKIKEIEMPNLDAVSFWTISSSTKAPFWSIENRTIAIRYSSYEQCWYQTEERTPLLIKSLAGVRANTEINIVLLNFDGTKCIGGST